MKGHFEHYFVFNYRCYTQDLDQGTLNLSTTDILSR